VTAAEWITPSKSSKTFKEAISFIRKTSVYVKMSRIVSRPSANYSPSGVLREPSTCTSVPPLIVMLMRRISKQLYADITHFVLELIQNADDNEYNTNIEPTLHLALSRQTLIVKSNEVGFTKDNVHAICDINASTKRQKKNIENGCIGEKGIGKIFHDVND
jgi:hypothetical protein